MARDKRNNKKKSKGIVRKALGSCFNIKAWLSYDELTIHTENTVGFFRRLFSQAKVEPIRESYEEAILRLQLTPEQLAHRKKVFRQSAYIYLGSAALFFIYTLYLIYQLRWLATLFGLVMTSLLVIMGYREHFWYVQMEKQKLGCSFRDWLEYILRRR